MCGLRKGPQAGPPRLTAPFDRSGQQHPCLQGNCPHHCHDTLAQHDSVLTAGVHNIGGPSTTIDLRTTSNVHKQLHVPVQSSPIHYGAVDLTRASLACVSAAWLFRRWHGVLCRLGERGVCALAPELARSTRLTALSLTHNSLGTAGAAAVGSALAHNTSLRRLALAGNGAGPAAALMLGRAAAAHPYLTALDLSDNPIGETGALAVLRAAGRRGVLRDLDLRGCHMAAAVDARRNIDTFNPEAPNGDYRLNLEGACPCLYAAGSLARQPESPHRECRSQADESSAARPEWG